MRKVKAKFNCTEVAESGGNKNVALSAVHGTEGENADFTAATPTGQIQIGISGDVPASEFFEAGKDYYVYFEAVKD